MTDIINKTRPSWGMMKEANLLKEEDKDTTDSASDQADLAALTEPDIDPTAYTDMEKDLRSFIDFKKSAKDLEFRQQVIKAFKHLGLDTRKFFGE
ncbi:MAG TPA: hypothetical protein VFA52_04225 [Candidatus Paceibacterota bacterium]|jgi:hypothetical protein|nr:hypothetical protein [Candidatus Paceibacterota bacterium]